MDSELEIYKKALLKITQFAVEPSGETRKQRIKRLKSIADKALELGSYYGHR